MNKQIAHIIICILPLFLNAQVTIISVHNELPSQVFVTLSTTDKANNRQLSKQFSIDANDTVAKEIILNQNESFTVQIKNPDARWKKAMITFKSLVQTKDNPATTRTFKFNVELDDTAVNPIVITDSPRKNIIKNSNITLRLKKDGVTLD